MNLDSIGNTFAASFGSVKRVIPRVDEKKSRSKENTDEFRSVPAKYALPQPM